MSTNVNSSGSDLDARRVEMARVDLSVLILAAFGAMLLGASVGTFSGNGYFVYISVALCVVAVLIFAVFEPESRRTRPASGDSSAMLPVASLIVAETGVSVLGIALGHASLHLIRTRGGAGEKIALAALILGYSLLVVEIGTLMWFVTAFGQFFGASH